MRRLAWLISAMAVATLAYPGPATSAERRTTITVEYRYDSAANKITYLAIDHSVHLHANGLLILTSLDKMDNADATKPYKVQLKSLEEKACSRYMRPCETTLTPDSPHDSFQAHNTKGKEEWLDVVFFDLRGTEIPSKKWRDADPPQLVVDASGPGMEHPRRVTTRPHAPKKP